MQKHDSHWLADRLTELSEALGSRPLGPKAIPVWLDALGDCKADDVKAVLADWPKFSVKMPAPADVRKKALERFSESMERAAKASGQRDGTKALAGPFRTPASSAIAERHIEQIKTMLRGCDGRPVGGHFHHIAGNSRLDPREWAKVLQVKHECGDELSFAQTAAYREALGLGAVANSEKTRSAEFGAHSDNRAEAAVA